MRHPKDLREHLFDAIGAPGDGEFFQLVEADFPNEVMNRQGRCVPLPYANSDTRRLMPSEGRLMKYFPGPGAGGRKSTWGRPEPDQPQGCDRFMLVAPSEVLAAFFAQCAAEESRQRSLFDCGRDTKLEALFAVLHYIKFNFQ
jgi:hypothetical protein